MQAYRTDFDDSDLQVVWKSLYNTKNLQTDTFFQSWEWNYTWWKVFGVGDRSRELLLIKVMNEGEIVAIAPFFLQKRQLFDRSFLEHILWIADELSPYPDLITTKENVEEKWCAIRAYCETIRPAAWLQLRDIFSDSTLSLSKSSSVRSRRRKGSTYLRLEFEAHNGKQLMEIAKPTFRRTLKKAIKTWNENKDISWHFSDTGQQEEIVTLERLNRNRFGNKSFFADKQSKYFFDSLFEVAKEEFFHSVLKYKNRILHNITGFKHNGHLYYFLAGMDAEFSDFQPGFINFYNTLNYARDYGYKTFDFLRGTERYKYDFGASECTSDTVYLLSNRSERAYRIAYILRYFRRAIKKMNT